MSVLTPQHIRPDLSVRQRPSCLSIPPHLPSAFHGSSVKQYVGQALKACSTQLPHVRQHEQHQQQHRPAVHTQALHAHPGCMPSPAHLGWHGNFTSKFTLGPVLGRGSFGTVHEAVRNSTGASYAVKVLQKTGRPAGPGHLEAIKREVCSWAQAQGSKFVAKLEGLYEVSSGGYACSAPRALHAPCSCPCTPPVSCSTCLSRCAHISCV
jgi:serine/threonine protein kinase